MSATAISDHLCSRLLEHAQTRPDSLAYGELDKEGSVQQSLTYRELLDAVVARAEGLRERDLVGQRVVLALPTGIDVAVTLLACLWAGTVPVIVNPPRRAAGRDHLEAVLADATPKLVISAAPLQVSAPDLRPLDLDLPSASPSHPVPAEGLALLQYTSGSTSRPRGVMVTHDNLLANSEIIRISCGLDEGCSMVSWLPAHHDMGLMSKIVEAIHLGGHLTMLTPTAFAWKPYLWLKAISDRRAVFSGAPNFAYDLCVEKITPVQRATLDLSSWRCAFSAAEPIRRATVERFLETFAPHGFEPSAFRAYYGLAEATLCVAGQREISKIPFLELDRKALEQGQVVEAPGGAVYAACGTTVEPTRIEILDPKSQQPLEQPAVGEIALYGPAITPGYWGQAPRPEGQPFLTGDLGFVRESELFVVGRLKDMIIVDGRNLYPEDLEATVELCHPSIRPGNCAAFALPGEGRERLVLALEIRHPKKDAVEAAVRRVVGEHHEVAVDHVIFVKPGGLPRTSSGKVRRKACGQALAGLCEEQVEGPPVGGDPVEFEDARDPVEEFLCQALAREARLPRVAATARFDEVGVSSVLRFSLMGELAQRLGTSVPGDATWTYPTPRELARTIRDGFPDGLTVRRLGTGIPVFFLHDISGGTMWAEQIVEDFPDGFTLMGLRPDSRGASTLEEMAAQHAETIMQRYGQGPYLLVGFSAGGRLAYETARQIGEFGGQVPLLVVVDGSPQDAVTLPPAELLRQLITRIVPQAWTALRQEGSGRLWRGARAGLAFLYRWLWGKLTSGRARLQPAELPIQVQTHHDQVRLASAYRPQPWDGRVLVYRAPTPSFSTLHAPGGGWDRFARGGVEVIDEGDDHWNILVPPHSGRIARDLAQRARQIG